MMFLNSKYFFPLGMISLVLAIVIGLFLPSYTLFDFLAGVFTGLAITLNIAVLATNGRRLGNVWVSE